MADGGRLMARLKEDLWMFGVGSVYARVVEHYGYLWTVDKQEFHNAENSKTGVVAKAVANGETRYWLPMHLEIIDEETACGSEG